MEKYIPTQFTDTLALVIWNTNTLQDILFCIGLTVLSFVILRLFRTVILRKLARFVKKTKNTLDDTLVELFQNISRFFYWTISLIIGTQKITLPESIKTGIHALFLILLVWESIKIAQKVIEFVIQRSTKQKDSTALAGIRIIIKLILWSIGLLMILSNLGVDVSALVASLGIGGIAVALAAQNILGDLFSSFSIYFDKPFEIGDFIMVGGDSGTVKKIGLKTTRIQTMQGEELVISNKELTTARVQNFKKLKNRRVTFTFGVTYDTQPASLKKIPEIIKTLIDAEELAESDRVVFTDFGDFSLNFQAVYYLNSADYAEYAQTQHRINIAVLDALNKEKIEMAFPTQTIHLEK